VGIHRTWASRLEPFMGPPVGRARSPLGLGPHNCRGPEDTLPQKARGPPPGTLGGLSACSSAIFHIRELHVLNTISNIIGFAVAAGHRLLTRTREQEPMGRPRRTRTREPPGGAQSSPARAIMAGLLQTRNARAGGWVDGADARTPTPEARHGPGRVGGH
jgi:hypothetical protein